MAEHDTELLGSITRPLIIPSQGPATMRIASAETALGYVIINATDFDAATMTEYVESSGAPKPSRKSAKAAE